MIVLETLREILAQQPDLDWEPALTQLAACEGATPATRIRLEGAGLPGRTLWTVESPEVGNLLVTEGLARREDIQFQAGLVAQLGPASARWPGAVLVLAALSGFAFPKRGAGSRLLCRSQSSWAGSWP